MQNNPIGFGRGFSVNQFLLPLSEFLNDEHVTEICINRPFEVWTEKHNEWQYHEMPMLSMMALENIAVSVAKYGKNNIDNTNPILSATLPKGERIQIVMPPACEADTLSITIRKPTFTVRSLEDYYAQGFFNAIKPISKDITPEDRELLTLKENNNYIEFLRKAVIYNKVIIVCGETGSGKTSFMKSLMQSIPKEQRIITIEDTQELFLPNHPNHVHLFYPSEATEDNGAIVTSAILLKSCLRMKPTRILLAELRGGEAFDFANVCLSGHGGSISSCHAGSAEMAFERLALMILQNRQGRTLPYHVIQRLLYLVVDVVVHVTNDLYNGNGRHISELWFDPSKKQSLGERHG